MASDSHGPAEASASDASVFRTPELHGSPHNGACETLRLSEDGRRLWTSGADGRLACSELTPAAEAEAAPPALTRLWAQKISHGLGAALCAVAPGGERLALAEETTAGFQVWVHQLEPTGRLKPKPASAGRFTLKVRHLQWHPTLPYLCISTDDGKVDVWWDGEARGRRPLCRGSGDGAALCAALDAAPFAAARVAAAFASGQLAVFSVEDAKELYRAKLWEKSTSASSTRLALAWEPNGERLALPGLASVRLLDRCWQLQELKGGHRFSTTLAAWSPSGNVLVTASMEAVALWSHDRLQHIFEFAVPPVSLTWGGDFLAAATEAGEIAFLQADLEVPKAPAETAQSAPKEEGATTVPQDTEKPGEAKEELPAPAKPVTQAPVQLSFQPGATCGGSAGSGRRFLAWNEHGCLKLCPRRVQVDYFKCRDRSAPRELPSFEGLEFGALGPNFCALSSARKVLLHLATPLLSSRVCFEHELPFMERVEALAVGSFVAVFVSPQRLLRIFSTSFLPVAVLAMCGDCVAMVGSDERLFVVLQRCRGRRRENQLHFVLLDVEKGSRLAGGPLPLSPASTLRWIGFEGARPLALDSAGQVRALHGPGWVPVAQLSPHQWPVEADGKVLRCLEAKNGEVRVGAAKRLSSVALQAPFESFVPLAALDRDRAERKAALRVFEEQVKAKESELALDVARHFLAEVPAETLQAIAEKASLPELARRLGNKKQRLE